MRFGPDWQDPADHPILLEVGSVPAHPAVVARDQELGGWLIGHSALEEAYRDSVQVYRRLKQNVLQGNGDGQAVIQRLLRKLCPHCKEAVGHVPEGLTVTPVKTLADAVKAVENWTADGAIPACPVQS